MKHINFKILIITCIVCLSPIILGLAMWNTLPDSMAVHFNINNEPDGFAPKEFAVFGLPLLMVLFQIFCCIVTDIDTSKYNEQKKITAIAKWIIPTMTIVLYVITLGYGIGWNIDIRKVVSIVIGCIFITFGSYIPNLNHIKNYNVSPEKAKKINRFTGIGMIVIGLLMLITAFMPPMFFIACLILLVLFTIISAVYGIIVCAK